MASSHNVELEAAKFLHKLIQESTDEPVKLATKLYVILQHMKASGKELSMPYLVISRAMETVITQNGLDIEALKSSRLPLTSVTQVGDSATAQYAGSSQAAVATKDSKADNEMPKTDSFTPGRPPAGPSSAGHDYYQGSITHRTSRSFDHESPSSLDSRSANSQSQERRDTVNREKQVKDGKKIATKRKRADLSLVIEPSVDNSQQIDSHTTVANLRKGKMNKAEPPCSHSVQGADHSHFNMLQSSGQMEGFPSLSGSMRSMLRGQQEGQNLAEKSLDSANISSSVMRNPNTRYPEEVEVSSTHNALGLQQGGSILHKHDVVSSRGVWNQNKMGSVLEESQAPRFSPSVVSGNMKAEISMKQSTPPSLGPNIAGNSIGGFSSDAALDSGFSNPVQFSGSSYDNHGLVSKLHQGRSMEAFSAGGYDLIEPSAGKATQGDEVSVTVSTGKVLVHEGGSSSNLANATKILLGGRQNSITEMSMLRSGAPRDSGKSGSAVSFLPFKEQQLKQLRAQCLVFLAFRNGMMPKKLHLEIALGYVSPKEGKVQSFDELSGIPNFAMPFKRLTNVGETYRFPPGSSSSDIEAEYPKMMNEKNGLFLDLSVLAEERKHLLDSRKLEAELQAQEASESQASLMTASQEPGSSGIRGEVAGNSVDYLENFHFQGGKVSQASSMVGAQRQVNPEMISWTGIGSHNEVSRGQFPASAVQQDTVPGRRDESPNQPQSLLSNGIHEEHHPVIPVRNVDVMPQMSQDGFKIVADNDAQKNDVSHTKEQENETKFEANDFLPTPKYTMSEKWIMIQQEKKHQVDQTWVQKQQKTERKIARCFGKLKETVSSSEDISAKTKSVIELKKLQLLGLQRRLRSDFLNDFFKPISTEMDRLRTYKKHRHGRRIKQLEKFEQKMKEERQKRIRERQKEFFSEIEVHKERLEDVFKIRRERWKGLNKYVKEFHKRKERIHREKIDRIQREKINLLKINDVEGYLRMVQDAKSDRVKQLLKETEKYLQKLGSKLQEAKVVACHFEHDIDEIQNSSVFEKNETDIENEDESDQAKHYLESNEKYYLMAHSIKESIAEQPTCLQGGKLREYQMNGLRWLVSLYNNHLNGILADEMGLGKTVQVIALICYLMETKNDRGPFLVVVPSSVLPGWESEINSWAPSVHKIVYSGPPEERRRLFKERVVPQKFNVLLTTYEYLMNKHDRPKLSKVHWHYIIIDEGHRIKNASCKLNADLKHYRSSHRLLLTGTPLQNNLEELWALLNFLLPNIFNSSEDFSQWFNKPFQSNGDNSPDEALLSEEENLLIINRLHQVLRPFVLRRLKHKVENELPEKIERLIRCEASAYQKLLMKRVEDNLGAIGNSKSRSVHNSVMELRNICNHPYLSQLHAEEVDSFIPKHYLPPIIRLCGKLEMLDRLLPKLKATDHRVLFFSTMTRLLDVMEEYLTHKQYKYLRLDGHTSGGDRGALIDQFNKPDSPFFIFLLSIRAGGVGVNLQAADTVIIFDTDWNPQVDLQAQARAHRIGQKRDVLVLRFETVQTVEEQVRASAEHKLGVANQSITAGFFDNNTSAEDRREYLESLLRECKKEEAAPVLNDDALNDILARSESEIDIFESVDIKRQEIEKAAWQKLVFGQSIDCSVCVPPMPSRLVTDDDLKEFYEAMKIFEVPKTGVVPNVGVKRKGKTLGGLDTQHYGRGKRAREVRSYEEQWTEEEFEKLCQVESPDSPKSKEELTETKPTDASGPKEEVASAELPAQIPLPSPPASVQPPQLQQNHEITPPSKRGRGRPKRVTSDVLPIGMVHLAPSGTAKADIVGFQGGTAPVHPTNPGTNPVPHSDAVKGISGTLHHVVPGSQPTLSSAQSGQAPPSVPLQVQGQDQKSQCEVQGPRRRGRKQGQVSASVLDPKLNDQSQKDPIVTSETVPSLPAAHCSDSSPSSTVIATSGSLHPSGVGIGLIPQSTVPLSCPPVSQSNPPCSSVTARINGQNRKAQNREEAPRRRGRKKATVSQSVPGVPVGQDLKSSEQLHNTSVDLLESKAVTVKSKQENDAPVSTKIIHGMSIVHEEACGVHPSNTVAGWELKSVEQSEHLAQGKLPASDSTSNDTGKSMGPALAQNQNSVGNDVSVEKETSKDKVDNVSDSKNAPPGFGLPTDSVSSTLEGMHHASVKIAPSSQSQPLHPSVPPASQTTLPLPSQPIQMKRQGRKTTSRVDATRRRGRNHATTLPVHTVGLAGQDPISDPISQNKSIDSSGRSIAMRSKQANDAQELADVIKTHGQENHSSGTLASQALKRQEEQPAYAAQNKQPPSLPTALLTSGSSDKNSAYSSVPLISKDKMLPTEGLQTCTNPALGRIQTADVNDVARMMKELFSGTCPSKTKSGESLGNRDAATVSVSRKTENQIPEDQTCLAVSGNDLSTKIGEYSNEDRDVSTVPASEKGFHDVTSNHSLEDKTCVTVTNLETSAPFSDLPVDMHEKRSGAEADAAVEEDNATVLDGALISKNSASKAESTSTSVENMGDSRQMLNESSEKCCNAEVNLTVPSSAGQNDDVSCWRSPAPEVDLGDICTVASGNLVNSSMVTPDTAEIPEIANNCSTNEGVPSSAEQNDDVSCQRSPALEVDLTDICTVASKNLVNSTMVSLDIADIPEMANNCSTHEGDTSLNELSVPAIDLPIEKYEKQSGDASDTKVELENAPLASEALDSRRTTYTPEDMTSDGPVNIVDPFKLSIENLVTESTNLTSAVPENTISGLPVEVMEESRELLNENLTNRSIEEDICTVAVNASEKDDVCCQISPACYGDLTDFRTTDPSKQLVSPSASPVAVEPSMTTKKHLSNQANDDISGFSTEPCSNLVGSPSASPGALDPCTMTLSISGNQVESGLLEVPAAAVFEISVDKCEHHSGTEADSNLGEDIARILVESLDFETVSSESASRTTSGSIEKAACSRNLCNEKLLTGLNTELICNVPETSIASCDSTEIVADARMIFNENPHSGSILDVSCVVPVDAGQKDAVSCQRLKACDGDLTCFMTDAPSNKVNLPLISSSTAETPVTTPNDSGNNADSSLQASPDSPVFDLSIDKYEKHSGTEGDTKVEQDTSPVLDEVLDSKTTCEPEGSISASSPENTADLRNDLFEKLTAYNQEPICTVPENNITAQSDDIVEDSSGPFNESSIAGSTMDVCFTIPINTGHGDVVSSQGIPSHDGDRTGCSTGSPSNPASAPLASVGIVDPPTTTENSFGNQSESCLQENPNASVMDLSIDKCEEESGREADAKIEKDNAPVSGEALNFETAPEPESRTSSVSVEKMEDTIKLCIANSESERHKEVIDTVPLNVGKEDDVVCERAPALDENMNDYSPGICSNEVVLPLASPSSVEPPETTNTDSGYIAEPSSKESPKSSPQVGSFGCPTISMETGDAISHLEETLQISIGSDPSCSVNPSSVNENSHLEMSLKFSPPDPGTSSLEPAMILTKDDGRVDHPRESHSVVEEPHVVTRCKSPESSSIDIGSQEVAVPIKGDDVGNHPNLITFASANPDHTGERECLGMIINNYGVGSPEHSDSMDGKASEEASGDGVENSPTVNDVHDGNEGNLETVCGRSEDKDENV